MTDPWVPEMWRGEVPYDQSWGHKTTDIKWKLYYKTKELRDNAGGNTYDKPYIDPEENVSLMAEAEYRFPASSKLNGWAVKGAVALDRGKIYGDNTGFQLTVSRRGMLNLKKKK
jgi:hypothetical protein